MGSCSRRERAVPTQSEAGDTVRPVLVATRQHTSHQKLRPENQGHLHSWARARSRDFPGQGQAWPPSWRSPLSLEEEESCPQALTPLAFATQRSRYRKNLFRAPARALNLEFLGRFGKAHLKQKKNHSNTNPRALGAQPQPSQGERPRSRHPQGSSVGPVARRP